MYTEKVETYLNSFLPAAGYVLDSVTYTAENGTNYLRAFVMKADESDMTVNDCAMISRRLSKWLDKEDFIPEEYMLEVCSMGFKENPSGEINEEIHTEEAGE